MATIVTLHGTFASGSETGDQWWQKGSQFEAEIRKRVEADDGELVWQPVIWDGLNSETSRRRVGAKLFEAMAALDKSQQCFALIGHSHGGSVISSALMEAARHRHPLKKMTAWLTVGTPFIQTEKERLLFSRLGLLGKSFYVALLTGFLILAAVFGTFFGLRIAELNGDTHEIIRIIFFALLGFTLFVTPFAIFYFLLRWISDRRLHRYNARTTNFAKNSFRLRWMPFWHVNDEAVRALGSLKTLTLNIFAKDFVVNPISVISVFLLPAIVLAILPLPPITRYLHELAVDAGYKATYMPTVDTADLTITCAIGAIPKSRLDLPCEGNFYLWNLAFLTDAPLVFTYIMPFRPHIIEGPWKQLGWPDALIGLVWFSAVLMCLALLLTFLVQLLAMAISLLISRWLNPFTANQIRAMAFGSDTTVDNAVDAMAWPTWLGIGHPPLPDAVGDPIQASSDAAVAKVVPKFRNALGAFGAAENREQQLDMLSQYLTWDELIHTSYFTDLQFAKLVAFSLTKTDGFRATDAFCREPDFSELAGWYSEILDLRKLD